jgi:hypothetical protein
VTFSGRKISVFVLDQDHVWLPPAAAAWRRSMTSRCTLSSSESSVSLAISAASAISEDSAVSAPFEGVEASADQTALRWIAGFDRLHHGGDVLPNRRSQSAKARRADPFVPQPARAIDDRFHWERSRADLGTEFSHTAMVTRICLRPSDRLSKNYIPKLADRHLSGTSVTKYMCKRMRSPRSNAADGAERCLHWI